jgi:hypothetical protein
MSTPSGDSVRDEIVENALVAGNPVKTSVKGVASASGLLYTDSSSKLASGALPMAAPVDVSGQATTTTFLNLTGKSSLSGTADMTLTLVAGSAYTTFTKSGAIRVTITDASGNVVSGDHYIQIGLLS